jgi:hypothetical protein
VEKRCTVQKVSKTLIRGKAIQKIDDSLDNNNECRPTERTGNQKQNATAKGKGTPNSYSPAKCAVSKEKGVII